MFAAAFVSAALLVSGVAADFKAWAPANVTSCAPLAITWEKAAFPISVLLVHSDDPCGDIVADLGEHNVTSMHWNATLPEGRYVLSLEDANGDEAWTESFNVYNSTDASCQYHTANATNNAVTTSGNGTLTVPASGSSASDGSAGDAGAVAAGAAAAGSDPFSSGAIKNAGAALGALSFAGAVASLLL